MKLILPLLLFFIITVNNRIFSDAFSSFYDMDKLNQKEDYGDRPNAIDPPNKKPKEDMVDIEEARKKAEILDRVKNYEKRFDSLMAKIALDTGNNVQRYRKDPVLNMVKRRYEQSRRKDRHSSDSESSSSRENAKWKDEWKSHWLHKKLEAVNSSMPKGDMVNMVAARPWGVPCGDPNQHDLPWGNCMLPMECEPEYRIYRGDYFCGRTRFICCALQITNYDLYGGFDVSFADSSLATDSEEKKNKERGSKERKRRKRITERKKRVRQRKKRKRKIKKTIRKITREIKKILNKSFRNGTTARKRKTKQLKNFIKNMKNKFKKDRQSVKEIHEIELIKIDAALQKRLDEIRGVNRDFIRNSTFRDIVVNGTVNKQNMRKLVEAYPELKNLFDKTRRRGTGKSKDFLEYDIEYGYLYY